MNDFLSMGGYGLYVWSSYALMLVVLLFNVWLPLRRLRRHRRKLRDDRLQQEFR